MKFVFIMDPLESVKAYKDTTFFLMLGAQELGHQVFHMLQTDLSVDGGRVFGRITPVTLADGVQPPFRVE